jgi:3-hydroxymyristoyl/3-hydroxydecanoyl-(acyl carrier protein) dehydratase
VSQAGGMVIEAFDVECSLGNRVVYTMTTVFGFFPPDAFEDQVGLPVSANDRELLELPSGEFLNLTIRPDAFCSGSARLPEAQLLMLDRVAHIAGAGSAGLGVVRGEKDVDIAEWFFKAHFFQDPVQPGSLGIEALLQLLQFFMLDTGMDDGIVDAHFEPIQLGAPMVWKYRGQVTPKNSLITSTMEITETGVDDVGPYVVGAGSLWCDGLRIYEVSNMGMRLTEGSSGVVSSAQEAATTTKYTVSQTTYPQLVDHAVNGTPVVPVAFVVDWFARAAVAHRPSLHLASLSDVRVLKGLVADDFLAGGSLTFDVTARTLDVASIGTTVALELVDPLTKRMHYRCTAILTAEPVTIGAPDDLARLSGASEWAGELYDGAILFHEREFQMIDSIDTVSAEGMTASMTGVVDRGWLDEPWVSDPSLLDGALQLALRWTGHLLGARSLPTGIKHVHVACAPQPGPHSAVLTAVRSTQAMVVCDIVITGPDGQLSMLLDGVETHTLG